MLTAVLNGKRRGTGFEGRDFISGDTTGAEDVLTSTIFERIAYLPDTIFSDFMEHLLDCADSIGVLESIDFWPSWYFQGQRVEPDAVLFCRDRTVIVEAKRHDNYSQQYAKQLALELQAGWESENLTGAPILLTIGGLTDYTAEASAKLSNQIATYCAPCEGGYELICRSWQQVFLSLQFAINKSFDGMNTGLQRMLNDIAETYKWHGLRSQAPRWLSDLRPIESKTVMFSLGKFDWIKCSSVRHLKDPLSKLPRSNISTLKFPIKTWRYES